jgi:hypothetical protein
MLTMRHVVRGAACVAAVLGMAGCGAGAAGRAPGAASKLPLPFTVVARFSAASLGLRDPSSLAIGPDGNVYVSDRTDRVSVISPTGNVLRRWGRSGTGPGELLFVAPDGFAPWVVDAELTVAPNGLVYVSDSGNSRVEVFTSRGHFVRQLRLEGEYGPFPVGLAVDAAGNVYVADDSDETLSKLSPSGRELWRIGGIGATNPDFAGHFHLASIDRHDRLVLLNDGPARVLYVDRDGHELDAFGGRGTPLGHWIHGNGNAAPPVAAACDVTVDSQGKTYVSGCARGRNDCPAHTAASPNPTAVGCGASKIPLDVFDRTHRLIARWPGSKRPSFAVAPRFGPHGEVFALATDGSLLELRPHSPG